MVEKFCYTAGSIAEIKKYLADMQTIVMSDMDSDRLITEAIILEKTIKIWRILKLDQEVD